ncbi:MAG: hypothetical protein R3B48_27625 [Kofleriaceae bacterium]
MKLSAILCCASLASFGCGDDASIGELPDLSKVEITMQVVPKAELDANGGTAYVAFVAYQEGEEPWRPMAKIEGLYRATIQSERFGVAVGCAPHPFAGTEISVAAVRVHQATVEDGTDLSDFSCVELLKPHAITGTAISLPSGGTFLIGTGEGSSNAIVRADGFSIPTYASLLDVIGYYNGGTPASSLVLRIAADPKQPTPLLFDFSRGLTPVTFPVTTPAASGPVLVSAHVRTSSNQRLLHLWSGAGELSYSTLPRGALRPSDLIRVGITATSRGRTQESFVYLAEPGPAQLALAPMFNAAAPTVARDPSPRARFTLDLSASDLPLTSYRVSATTRSTQQVVAQSASLSEAWLRGASASAYELPDLSAIPGWDAGLSLLADAPLRWEITRFARSSTTYEFNLREHVDTAFGELTN